MPLLRGKPFEPVKPGDNFRDDEELFPCEMTDEVFRTYEELCERIILCNSVDWSCSITGKSGLTYLEALESEENATRSLEDIPQQLRVPVLYLAGLTQRTSFLDFTEDIFSYIRDRYFIGEYVEVCLQNEAWFDCCVTRVIPPSSLHQSAKHSPTQVEFNRNMAALFRYEVQKLDSCSDDVSEIFEVGSTNVKRKKTHYTRDKSKMFLKVQTVQDENGMWVVKDEVIRRYNLNKVKFGDIFGGPPPLFECSRKIQKLLPNGLTSPNKVSEFLKREKRQEKIDKYFSPNKLLKGSSSPKQQCSSNKLSPRKYGQESSVYSPQSKLAKKLKSKYINNSMKGSVKKNLLQNHQLKKHMSPQKTEDVRLLEAKHRQQMKKAQMKEEKLELAKFMKEWNREREDLECEDLKDLPLPSIINCGIPEEHFGDFIMILEFFSSFKNDLATKKYFPNGQVTFDIVKRALLAKEVAGPLCDILELLLTTLFEMQTEEEEEIRDADTLTTTADLDIDDLGDVTMGEAIRAATAAVNWSQIYQGTPLSKLTLDAVTITEVLRLHLLSSGGRSGEQSLKWRYQQRGGYTLLDDPGLQLRIQHPHILRALSVSTVAELPIGDKLKVLTCLINQLLTYATFLDVIDERAENVRQLKLQLRTSHSAEVKQRKEAIALRIKKKKEAKQQLLTNGGNLQDPRTDYGKAKDEFDKAKDARDWERKMQEWEKKALEIEELAVGFQLLPLGVDRAYRRYWLFSSLPGLFVENEEMFPGVCLPKPTPFNPSLVGGGDTAMYLKQLFEEERNGSSDKENDSYGGPVFSSTSRSVVLSPSKKLNALSPTNAKVVMQQDVKPEPVVESKVVPQTLACTANMNTCPVHSSNVLRTRWAFFSEEEELQSLIRCLNKRGIREGKLRRALTLQQERILHNMKSCPISKLDENRASEIRKSSRVPQPKYDDANLSFPADMPVEDVMELTLIDCIIQLEEKIEGGGLGTLKVHSRGAWQEALTNRSYSQQCERLVWGKGTHKANGTVSSNPVSKLKMEDIESRPNTPNSEDGVRLLNQQDSVGQRPVVKNLASALLQVAQSVDPKYMQKPLGPDSNNDEYNWSAMERWESSLMACTSFAQVFLHLSTLDNSIQWRRSAFNAFCRLCHGRKDAENMLLCDGCNRGHHLYCLKPKLTRVPQGDWFCDQCRPKEKVRTTKKVRKLFSEESEDDVEATDSCTDAVCDSCGHGGRLLTCEECSRSLHFKCITPSLRKKPKTWVCTGCQAKGSHNSRKKRARRGEEEPLPRQQRCCAAVAVANISKFAKRLRSESWDDDSSVKDDEEKKEEDDMQPSRRSHRRSHALDESLPLDNAVLQDFLTELIHHKDGWPFLKPVQRAQAPDYHIIIKNPMDFGKMKNKLNMLQYTNNSEFVSDAILVFDNCSTYNDEAAEEYKAGMRLNRFFVKRCQQLGLKIPSDAQPSDAKRARMNT